MEPFQIKPRRLTAALLSVLGLACFGIAASLPFLLTDPILGFLLMGLPMLFSGGVALQHGTSLRCAELTLDAHGLQARLPQWRGFPAPPCRRTDIPWEQVHAIRHRREHYWLWIRQGRPTFPLLPVDAYLVEFDGGQLLLAGNMLPQLPAVVQAIARYRGLPVQEQEPVIVGAPAALLGRLPSWDRPV